MTQTAPVIGILMGSDFDWPIMQAAVKIFKEFGIGYEARVISAHRAPDALFDYVSTAAQRGLRALIGVLAAKTTLPVLGVPMPPKHRQGLDSLLSIVQMPKGIPVATLAIGEAGAANAALLATTLPEV